MRFDPQSDFLPEHDDPVDVAANNHSSSAVAGTAVASVAVMLSALLGLWIWQQQMMGVEQANAAEPGEAPQHVQPPVDESAMAAADEKILEVAAVHVADVKTNESSSTDFSLSISYHSEEEQRDRAQRSASVLELGKQQLAIGRTTRAVELLKEAIELNPTSAEAHYNLGLAYVLRGEMAAARHERDSLGELDRNLASLLGNLVR